MSLADDLTREVKKIFRERWSTRDGQKVPDYQDLQLGNEAVLLQGAVLYADLAQSTRLVDGYPPAFAAEVYKAYLHCAAKIIRDAGGVITAYDGDRIMGVFIGGSKNTNAAGCALCINHAVTRVINPALREQYPGSGYDVRQAVGVDTSGLFVARTGVRGANDLVWVGRSANYAAKLCSLRTGNYASWITKAVYDAMSDAAKYSSEGRPMWEVVPWPEMGITVYRSDWWRAN